jgi:hypothetical protein
MYPRPLLNERAYTQPAQQLTRDEDHYAGLLDRPAAVRSICWTFCTPFLCFRIQIDFRGSHREWQATQE